MAVADATSSDPETTLSETPMRSLLLFFLGVPIPIIILIALFTH